MIITMNGSEIDFSLEGERDVGDLLSSLDSWLEERGYVMSSLSVDGADRSGDIGPVKDLPVAEVGRIDIGVAPLAGYRASALERAAAWAERAAACLSAGEAADGAQATGLSAEGRELIDARSGFLDPDELSLLEWILGALSGAAPSDPASAARSLAASAALKSRAADLRDPVAAVGRAMSEYDSLRPRLVDLPVLLQTARDREALSVLTDFSEFFARAVRIIPVLSAAGIGLGSAELGGRDPAEFYSGLNRVLGEFIDAYSSQDTVLVGDLCEYEILPQLDVLFKGIASRAGA